MVQFSSGSYNPMDREYHSSSPDSGTPKLEKPIVPVNELGVTVVERDPVTGGNILQNVDAAIRQGASKMQLVFNQQASAIGGGAKSYGKQVRENLRELARANDVMIEGVEMPTSSYSNMSGFNPQRGNISEEKRQQDLRDVKDAIRFIADVGGGGGVDIWSQEFQRSIVDSSWNQKGKWKDSFESYENEDHYATEYLVDRRTGQILKDIQHSTDIFEPVFLTAENDFMGTDVHGNPKQIRKGDYITREKEWIDPTDREQLLLRAPKWDEVNKKFEIKKIPWPEIVARTQEHNEKFAKQTGRELDPAEYAFMLQMETRYMQHRGQSLYYTQRYEGELKQLDSLNKSLAYYEKVEKEMSEEDMWKIMQEDPMMRGMYTHGQMMKPTEIIKQQIGQIKHSLKHVHEASAAADAQAVELQTTMDEGVISLKKFARSKAIESYADAGLAAMDETRHNENAKRDVYVGPEIGWPGGYGGHPEEFIDIIKSSRKEMAQRLVKERGMSKSEAKSTAEKHIKGCFDTGHMGMWLQHFKRNHPQESEESRRKRFNNWYMDMVKRMQDEKVIGSIQAVDSATGGHEHLPAGQGIFPVVEAVDYLKSHGFNGFVISEGHGEETFNRGRILLQTWKAFGAEIGDSYFSAAPRGTSWTDVSESYFGHVNPPAYVVGNYRPSEDWVFWSGVPLE